MESEKKYMERALHLARRGEGWVEPNPMVGAVLVKDNRVVGEGYHRKFGQAHAEVEALRDAREKGNDPRGAHMYVTLEPCNHHGKTPPCTDAIIEAGIKHVSIATGDPLWERHSQKSQTTASPRRGMEKLRNSGIEVRLGLCRNEAIMLNAPFFKRSATGLPLVMAKWAMSADGRIATRTGSSRWISCEDSRKLVHQIRGKVDAVIVGSGTALKDDPLLTCRGMTPGRTAARVVLCGSQTPSPDSRLMKTARKAPVIIAYPSNNPPSGLKTCEEKGCELMSLPDSGESYQVDIQALLQELGKRDMSNILVEGGSRVLGSFLDTDAIDRALIFIAPVLIGGERAVAAVGGKGASSVRHALSFKGRTVIEHDAPEITPEPETVICQSGKDILLSGWVHDPGTWHRDE